MALYILGMMIAPLAGLALLILLTIALTITIGPAAHFVLAKRAIERGSYSPAVTAANVACGIIAAIAVLVLMGVFNFG